jgi:roadblock/LC7 domain-containing protein
MIVVVSKADGKLEQLRATCYADIQQMSFTVLSDWAVSMARKAVS